MPIEFKARVLLELGAELISSDAVAIYELVKNSVDAGSPKVTLSFEIAMQHSSYRALNDYLRSLKPTQYDCTVFVGRVESALDPDAPAKIKREFLSTVGRPGSIAAAQANLDKAYFEGSSIKFVDWGNAIQ